MKLFLTSSPIGIYRSEEPQSYKGFNPANGMVEELHRFWKNGSRCILISAFPDEYELNDRMRKDYEGIVQDTGLSLSCMDICDLRNGKEKADALCSYDFVILGGGHVPTENAFFRSIGQKKKGERLKMNWFDVIGRLGRAHFKPRTYVKDGEERQTNSLVRFIDPKDGEDLNWMREAEALEGDELPL